MAWGYWSATSVNDRGRSPRREKDKSLHSQQQSQPPATSQYQTPSDVGGPLYSSGVVQAAELVALDPDDPSQVQGGAFYSYTLAAQAAAVAAGRRTPGAVDGTASGLLQAYPRDLQPRPGGSNYPPSPCSDSAEYEQPTIALHSAFVQQHDTELGDGLCRSRAASIDHRLKSLRVDDGDDDATDVELEEEIIVPEIIYEARGGPGISGVSSCLVHGPCSQGDLGGGPMGPIGCEHYSLGPRPPYASEVWLNDITWGR